MGWISFFKKTKQPAHLRSGEWGEQLAARMLRRKGYRIEGRRVLSGHRGEIDLIVRKKKTLVFVEVKTRANEQFGSPVSAVNAHKRKMLQRAACAYLRKQKVLPDFFRFDVVEVIGTPQSGAKEIRHLENVFQMPDNFTRWW